MPCVYFRFRRFDSLSSMCFFSLFIHFIRSPSLPFLLRLWHFQYTVWWNLFLCLFVHLRFWNSHYGYFKCFSLSTICLVIDASNNLQICSFKIEWSFDWPCLVPNFSHSFNLLPNFASMWENKREKNLRKKKKTIVFGECIVCFVVVMLFVCCVFEINDLILVPREFHAKK